MLRAEAQRCKPVISSYRINLEKNCEKNRWKS
jgi:hypothetical protein